ncbi:MAG: DUF192 domain-containing protein [Myxococcales bacterium]|nr:DUF192 domain-containing protein [Myxococcales bacterium]
MRLTFAPALLLCLAGCGERPAAPAAAPATTPPSADAQAKACEADVECVGDWRPQMRGCGPVARCMEGRCVEPPAMTGVANAETARIVFETAQGEKAYQIELVDQPFETSRGLMCRDAMKPDWGMLFLMSRTQVQSFWMLNTLIPLDIMFLDEDWKVVGTAADAVPQTTTPRTVGQPSRYVLELNAGEAARAGLAPGTQARFYPPRAAE